MTREARERATAIVVRMAADDTEEAVRIAAAEELVPLVYDELRRLARVYLAGERPGHTLDSAALVHEAYVRLVDSPRDRWHGRTHFLAVSARVMRRLLIDHARRRGRVKRGGGWQRVTLTAGAATALGSGATAEDLLALDAALDKLSRVDAREVRVIELRFFAGLTMAEVATVLGVSKRTVEDDWAHARAWLERELALG